MQRWKHSSAHKRLSTAAIVGLALFAAAAGGIGLLHQSGVRSHAVDSAYKALLMQSDELAGQAFQTQVSGNNREALQLYREALRRDQASAYRWSDYAEAMLAAGDESRARRSMERAVELGPYIGPVRMRAVNFAYRTGDVKWALEQGLKLVGITPDYDGLIFSVWDQMDVDVATVLKAGLPDGRSARAYVRRLLKLEKAEDARAAWNWTLRRGFMDGKLADEYAESLIEVGKPEQGAHAWAQYAAAHDPGYPDENAVFNGGFEREPAGFAFDWRIYETQGARVTREQGTAAEGKWCLRLDFDRTQNMTYTNVMQRAAVKPGVWRFEARLKTDAITTDEGVGFRVFDADTETRLQVQTARLTGTHDWTRIGVNVPVGPATKSVFVQIIRVPSWRFDNKIGGTAWVDAVSLRPVAK